jgi:hypothetical protein
MVSLKNHKYAIYAKEWPTHCPPQNIPGTKKMPSDSGNGQSSVWSTIFSGFWWLLDILLTSFLLRCSESPVFFYFTFLRGQPVFFLRVGGKDPFKDLNLDLLEVKIPYLFCSVADPGCFSRILIFNHPGSRISDLGSRIPDPKTAMKIRGEKKLVVIPFLWSHKFRKT